MRVIFVFIHVLKVKPCYFRVLFFFAVKLVRHEEVVQIPAPQMVS